MFVPPWLNPIDPNVDATLAQEGNYLGLGMAADLTAAGKKGVVTNALYDFWTPSRHYMAYHAGMRILSEAASASLATPLTVRARTRFKLPAWATTRASEAGIIWSRGKAGRGGSATSSTIN